MPDPPGVGLIDRFVLENPWPGVLLLLVAAIAVGYTALVQGHLKRLPVALGLIVAAAALGVTGVLVKTSGERATVMTRQFVDAVVARDPQGAINLLAPDAMFSFDSPRNQGYDAAYIKAKLYEVLDEFTIQDNHVTRLDGYVETSGRGVAYLACITSAGYGPTLSKWIVEVSEQDDGSWAITRLTCVEVNNREASRFR